MLQKRYIAGVRLVIVIALLAFIPLKSFSDQTILHAYKVRSFNTEKIEEFKSNQDFKYTQPPKLDPLKQSILGWIAYRLGVLLAKVPRGVWTFIPYLLGAIAIGLIIFYIRKVTFTGAVSLSNNQVKKGPVYEENIHSMNFDNEITNAIAKGQFRLAVRLYFLKTLKFLDDKKLIAHSREKTNRDYLIELRNSPMSDDFRWLARAFEFVWYGNLNPGKQRFDEIKERYDNFFRQLSNSK